MDIVVKGRHTEVPERFRKHVADEAGEDREARRQGDQRRRRVSKERNPRQADQRERVELTIRSRGPVVRAEAAAQDCYAALDVAVAKLEARLRKAQDRRKVHHGAEDAGLGRDARPPPWTPSGSGRTARRRGRTRDRRRSDARPTTARWSSARRPTRPRR